MREWYADSEWKRRAKMLRKRKEFVILMVVMALVMVTAVAYALTITIDGDPTDWPGSSLLTDDGLEADVEDRWDIRGVYATNDGPAASGNAFFMLQTEIAMEFNGGDFLYICIDSDNDDTNGEQSGGAGFPSACTGAINGIDRVIRVSENDPFASRIYNCSTGSCVSAGMSPTFSFNSANRTIEVSETLSNLGITAAVDGECLPLMFYYDNDSVFDDIIPNGTSLCMPVGTGSPTAVTLQDINASGQSAVLPFVLGAFGLIVVSTGLVINRKRKSVQ
jgi:hypothetical protein